MPDTDHAHDRTELAVNLFSIGAIKFGAFRLKLHDTKPDAPLSPFYIDLRLIRSYPALMNLATDLFVDLMRPLRFDLIADVPTAGTPFAAIVSHKMQMPMVTPRLDSKRHGSSARIDGVYQPGQTAVVLDDLITRAESKIEAVEVLRSQGLNVTDVVVLVDREQGGVQQLERSGLTCHAALRLSELIDRLQQRGLVTPEQVEAVVRYVNESVSS
jgi:uridine monophosphate synthetase